MSGWEVSRGYRVDRMLAQVSCEPPHIVYIDLPAGEIVDISLASALRTAHILAAAKDLLEACKAGELELITLGIGRGSHSAEVVEKMGAAIRRAEGL